MARFLAGVRAGEHELGDEVTEGRSQSLRASLKYGFERAFDDSEQGMVSVVSLFERVLDAEFLAAVARAANVSALEPLGKPETALELLHRAAGVGVLNPLSTVASPTFRLHPALPWFLAEVFTKTFRAEEADRIKGAFMGVIAELSGWWHDAQESGAASGLRWLDLYEPNLRRARAIAIDRRDHLTESLLMMGLRPIMERTGRWSEWGRLLREASARVTDENDGALEGDETAWMVMTPLRADFAARQGDMEEAERLQWLVTEYNRSQAPALPLDRAKTSDEELAALDRLGTDLNQLAVYREARGDSASLPLVEEALEVARALEDDIRIASRLSNLAAAYIRRADVDDIDRAETCLQEALERFPNEDARNRSVCLGLLSSVYSARAAEAANAGDKSAVDAALGESLRLALEALEVAPQEAPGLVAAQHHRTAATARTLGRTQLALHHYQAAVRLAEQVNAPRLAAQALGGIALVLRNSRPAEARLYAARALEQLRRVPGDAHSTLTRTLERLLADTE